MYVSCPLSSLSADPDLELFATCCAIMIKFFVSINFYISNLQAMETYPTCLRQTGISIGSIVANVFGMLGPYIVLLVSGITGSWWWEGSGGWDSCILHFLGIPQFVKNVFAGNQLRCQVSVHDSVGFVRGWNSSDDVPAGNAASEAARDPEGCREVWQDSALLVHAKAIAQDSQCGLCQWGHEAQPG